MAYLFMEESGDVGFKTTSSKWFLFTVVFVQNPGVLEKIIKKVWKGLKRQQKKRGELHAYHEDNITRKRVLRMLSEAKDLKIFSTILNKDKVYVDLQNQKNYLYNYTANVLLERFHEHGLVKPGEPIYLFVDRKDTKKQLRQQFIDLLTHSIRKKRNGQFSVSLHNSYDSKALQAVDFISWAIFRKYERGDYEFYEIIKNKIFDERLLFP